MAFPGERRALYTGFNHIVTFTESSHLSIDVFDYRRGLPFNSSCDVLKHPPLLDNTTVEDWVTEGRVNLDDLEFTYMGFELFMTQNRKTGHYVYRRCHDFNRPGVGSLPCHPVSSGIAPKLVAPWKLAYLGHNRAMLFNEMTAEYGVYFFDADVHTGGDPFHFSLPAIFSGVFLDFTHSMTDVDFAFVTLPNDFGDIIVAHQRKLGRVQGYKLAPRVSRQKKLVTDRVFDARAPVGSRMIALDENEIMFHNEHLSYQIWALTANVTTNHTSSTARFRVTHRVVRRGDDLTQGHSCIRHTANTCLRVPGKCAWCPTTKRCQPYDFRHNTYCDTQDSCAQPWTYSSQVPPPPPKVPVTNFDDGAAKPSPSPHASTSPLPAEDEEAGAPPAEEAAEFSDPDDIYDIVPDYRVGHDVPVYFSPIKPDYRAGPATENPIIEEDNAEDVIMEHNRVGFGKVFQPPQGPDDPDCMDKGYSIRKATEPRVKEPEDIMNDFRHYDVVNVRTSPSADSHTMSQGLYKDVHGVDDPSCLKNMSESVGEVSPTVNFRNPSMPPRVGKIDRRPMPIRVMDKHSPSAPKMETEASELTKEEYMNAGDQAEDGVGYDEADPQFFAAMNNYGVRQRALPNSQLAYDRQFLKDEVMDYYPVAGGMREPRIIEKPVENPIRVAEPTVYVPDEAPTLPPTLAPTPTPTPPPTPTPTPWVPIQTEMGNVEGEDPTPAGTTVVPLQDVLKDQE